MARKRSKNSKSSYNNMGLKPEEDIRLRELLIEKDISFRMLTRALVRQWINSGGSGILRYTK
jgi:hypothetical protein